MSLVRTSILLVLAPAIVSCGGDDAPVLDGGSTTGSTTGEDAPSPDGSGSSSGADPGSSSTGADETTTGTTGAEPGCGNGIVEAGEACDDAGESATCNADCTPTACGDGTLNATAGEACDDAGESAACNADCTTAACGDGTLNATAGELCDDGTTTPRCDDDCTPVACGDGVVNESAGELCDDGGQSAGCDVDCTPAECGDGTFNESAGEQCDDAGESAACNADCSLGDCGDGVVNESAGELCDDAGESATCNADCSPSSCGDGITNVTAGEACDDAGPTLGCDDDCTPVACGDSNLNPVVGEICDGPELAGATCQSLGFASGSLACGAACTLDPAGCDFLPAVPVLALSLSQVKDFDFSWAAADGAEHYQLLESAAPGEPFVPITGDIVGQSITISMPLHFRYQASYVLRACNDAGCSDSAPVGVVGTLVAAIGYFKASNPNPNDYFGYRVALSGDGNTLVVGAYGEDSDATGINGFQGDDSSFNAGAAYVFTRDAAGQWFQQAYVKPANTGSGDQFGWSVALSHDGNTLAVGARLESGGSAGINGPYNNANSQTGAVYVFVRNGEGAWSQQAYVKASLPGAGDTFGSAVDLSDDGDTLAVGAPSENSNATGVGGDQANDSAVDSGAAYVFVRNGEGAWSQQAYVKASNTDAEDAFGRRLALSGDGNTLAVGADFEDGGIAGIDGDGADDSAIDAGAVHVFGRDGSGAWSHQAYVKASNPGAGDRFGIGVALDGDGDTLAVGATNEDSNATGIDGNGNDESAPGAGAAYVFVRDGAGAWSQQAYVKGSNTDAGDLFGSSVALSSDGDTLAVGAIFEGSNAAGVGGSQVQEGGGWSGAAYVLGRDASEQWSQRSYIKASNPEAADRFGGDLSLSNDALTLAVGAVDEDSASAGIGGNQVNNVTEDAGAVYLY